MLEGIEILKVKKELESEVRPDAVDFVFHFLNVFSIYCKEKELQCTTATLVKELPLIVVCVAGHLADLYLLKINLTSYKTVGKILDTMVTHKLFRYHENVDSLEDFNTDRSIIEDVNASLVHFKDTLETNLSTYIKHKYANSNRT